MGKIKLHIQKYNGYVCCAGISLMSDKTRVVGNDQCFNSSVKWSAVHFAFTGRSVKMGIILVIAGIAVVKKKDKEKIQD